MADICTSRSNGQRVNGTNGAWRAAEEKLIPFTIISSSLTVNITAIYITGEGSQGRFFFYHNLGKVWNASDRKALLKGTCFMYLKWWVRGEVSWRSPNHCRPGLSVSDPDLEKVGSAGSSACGHFKLKSRTTRLSVDIFNLNSRIDNRNVNNIEEVLSYCMRKSVDIL